MTISDKIKHAFGIDTNYALYVDKQTDTEMKYYFKDDCLYLTFWGATSATDWKQFFNLKSIKVDNIKYHKGTYDKYKSVQFFLNALVKINKPKKIICNAFSQGGAVAQISKIDMDKSFPSIEKEYTIFGAYKSVYNYAKLDIINYVIKNDFARCFHLFRKGSTKIKILKKGYCIFKVIKNHFAYKECI